MSTFTLTVFPDGKLLLTTKDYLDESSARRILDLFKAWQETPTNQVLMVPDTEVMHARSFDVDLEGPERVEG